MNVNDVSLTAGMRSNLLSLQGTVALLDRTQNRLSSGKKVNTAIDNPVSFFAAQSLNSRASVIDSLKDAMGQAVQTITAADKGILAISSMIEQAKGIAQSALSAEAGGGVNLTMGSGINSGSPTPVDITIQNGMVNGDTVQVEGNLFTAGTDFAVTGDAVTDADALVMAIVMAGYVVGTSGTSTIQVYNWPSSTTNDPENLTAADVVISAHATAATGAGVDGETLIIGGVTLEASYSAVEAAASDTLFYTGPGYNRVSAAQAAQNLADEINNNAILQAAGYTATATDDVVNLQRTGRTVAADIGGTHAHITAEDVSTELESLQDQYNTLLDQLTALAEDSGYKGKNLLSEDDLTVKFEGATLSVEGFDASTAGLGITEATWTTGGDIDADVDLLDAALVTLRRESSKMSGNLSIITVRQGFSTDIMNTLTAGADKLTLADANEEGGNMLMLQTRQSLSTSALSMSAQAAQSVLRLFQ